MSIKVVLCTGTVKIKTFTGYPGSQHVYVALLFFIFTTAMYEIPIFFPRANWTFTSLKVLIGKCGYLGCQRINVALLVLFFGFTTAMYEIPLFFPNANWTFTNLTVLIGNHFQITLI